MVLGTSSSVGKSLLTAAFCRMFARRGIRVAPFKAQNMSNNAAVCADGAEIGRAQALQAVAAGIEPTADMNPVLLKPEADSRSQVIVLGRPWGTYSARRYHTRNEILWPIVTEALDRLRQAYDLVIIEGAGSPVELNLKSGDIVNMEVAKYARSPVLLVGDIDRGGVFSQLLGTLWLLEDEERALVRGLIVNQFRGDISLFTDGVRILEERGGVPVLGVIPYLPGLNLPEEDAVALSRPPASSSLADHLVDIAVIHLPHIANFDDFDPLATEAGVHLRYVHSREELGRPRAVILPGTKSTMADLTWLRERGLADAVKALAASGTAVVGICGGYQMLGSVLQDPARVEGFWDEMPGLGLLPVTTVFESTKATHRVRGKVLGGPGWLAGIPGFELTGYEIHSGHTSGAEPWLTLRRSRESSEEVSDGAATGDGHVWGCYLHGLFTNDAFRRAWLRSLGRHEDRLGETPMDALDKSLDRLAEAVAASIDLDLLEQIVWES